MNKRRVYLNESQLYNLVSRCVNRILSEAYEDIKFEKAPTDQRMVSKATKELTSIVKRTGMKNYTFDKISRILKNEINGIGQGGGEMLLNAEQQEPFYIVRGLKDKYSPDVLVQALDNVEKDYFSL